MHAANSTLERKSTSDLQRSGTHRVVTPTGGFEPRRSDAVAQVPRRSGLVLSWPLVAAVLAVATTATLQPWKWIGTESAEAAHEESHRLVQVVQPTTASTASVTLPGTLRPWQTASLRARVNGYVRAWHVDLGAAVQAGELLAEIDTPELDQELAQGEALADEADAAAVQARTERSEAQADLNVAEAQLLRAQADLKLARSQLVRREKLLERKVIVQEEYDTALRQTEAREADVTAAESDVARRRANLETRAAVIVSRESTVQSRRANVQRLRELQGFQKIVAPFDGVITQRRAEVGLLVSPSNEPLFVVEDMHRIRVQILVPQTFASAVHLGTSATVNLPESSLPGVAGSVTRMANAVDIASRTMLTEIELPNESQRLQPGSYSQVKLNVPQTVAAWTIPTNTLSMRVAGPHVVVVNEMDRTELRRVTLGRDLGARVVVTEGIDGRERLVVNPTDDLASGMIVQIDDSSEKLLSQR